MNKWVIRFAVLLLGLGIATAQTKQAAKTDAEIRQEIITHSIASYRGSCPCPYNVDRAAADAGGSEDQSK